MSSFSGRGNGSIAPPHLLTLSSLPYPYDYGMGMPLSGRYLRRLLKEIFNWALDPRQHFPNVGAQNGRYLCTL